MYQSFCPCPPANKTLETRFRCDKDFKPEE
jgi:hypothetical protein